jgi:hypothetical protein
MPLVLPSPPATPSHQKDIYLHTDDINMPAASVVHIVEMQICSCREKFLEKVEDMLLLECSLSSRIVNAGIKKVVSDHLRGFVNR